MPGPYPRSVGGPDMNGKIIWGGRIMIAAVVICAAVYWVPVSADEGEWTEGFEGYSVADLNGQDGWTATDGDIDVVSSTVYEGTRAITSNGAGFNYAKKDIAFSLSSSTGANYILGAHVRVANSASGDYALIAAATTSALTIAGSNTFCYGGINGAANIQIDSFNDPGLVVQAISSATWYFFEMELDFVNDRCRGRVDGGSWTAWINSAPHIGVESVRYMTFAVTGAGGGTRIDATELSGGEVPDATPGSRTYFSTFTPTLGVTTPVATSTSFTFGATGYVHELDYSSTTELYIRWRNTTPHSYTIDEFETHEIPVTAAGAFSLSTTTPVLDYGAYVAYFAIRKPWLTIFGFTLTQEYIVDSIGTFVVGTTTGGYEPSIQEIAAAELVMDTNLGEAAADMVVTSDATASSTVLALNGFLNFRQTLMNKFPINWTIDTVALLSALSTSTATTTLDEIEFDFGTMTTLEWVATTSVTDLQITFYDWDWIYTLSSLAGIQLLRQGGVWMLWVGLAFLAFKEAERMFRELSA